MEANGSVAERLQRFLNHYGLTARQAAVKMNDEKSGKIYKLLKAEAKPGFDTITKLLEVWPEVSADWLLMGRGSMLRTNSEASVTEGGTQVLTLTVGLDGKPNVDMVPILAQAGYHLQHNEAVFIEDLPKYRIPFFERGTFRAFEVAGDSMEPTINHADVVVCTFLDNWRLLEQGEVYVVVTDESVMLKRIKQHITGGTRHVLLHSDNPHRKPYTMEVADIRQLWRVRGVVSRYVPSAPDITSERLWEVIEQLGFDRGEIRRHLESDAPSDAPH